MDFLIKDIIQELAPNDKVTILYPGAFKPPHKGHFEVVKRSAEIGDKVIVIVSPKDRDGVNLDQSLRVWNLYKKLLPGNVEIRVAQGSTPVSDVYDIIKNNPNENFLAAFGKEEGSRFDSITKSGKYPNADIVDIGTIENFSATELRKAVRDRDIATIERMIPNGITAIEFLEAMNSRVHENLDPSSIDPEQLKMGMEVEKEHTDDPMVARKIAIDHLKEDPKYYTKLATLKLEQQEDPLQDHINSINQFMVDKGINIMPFPQVQYVTDDEENANQILGKTAYYNPGQNIIALYTLGRHPKDVLRSYAHELIHHAQNLQGRIKDIRTTDVNEDDKLFKLEEEAYVLGNMIFRSWENSLKGGINEETKPKKYYIFCDMDGVLVDFDKGYKDLTGVSTKHADVQNSKDFWNKLESSLKEKGLTQEDYWKDLDWMSDGKTLWNYIKQYNPYILTAPSKDPGSRTGKKEWVERLDNMKNIYFRKAQSKSDFAGKNKILIDDREDTIESWRAKGGIGILHTSAADTIEQLKQIGL
jgi:cytidyltransferase-like protein